MTRPLLEIADLIRTAGAAFIKRNQQWIRWRHVKVLLAIARCRTAALGGHLDECTRCAHRPPISYNSCRDRHCPKCQIAARERWIAARRRELLPTRYLHVVFTLPHYLVPLVLHNKKALYDILFHTSAETLLEVARDPRHLGAQIGFFSVLHTWNQKLQFHPHVHCVVPAGGLSPDPHPLGASPGKLLLAQSGAAQGLSWQVRGRSAAGFPRRPAALPRKVKTPLATQDLCGLVATIISAGLGGVLIG